LQQGRGEVALALGDSVTFAWAGDKDKGFPGKLDKLRAIGTIYPNYIQIVASEESGIRTIAELRGKRVSVGAPKSGTEINARAVFAAAGLSYDDMKVQYLPFGESVELIKNRQLDATLQSGGLGVASIRDLASSVAITMVAVPPEVVAKIGDPSFVPAVIPANTYAGQTADVATPAINNILVTRSDLPAELVYTLTKAMFENLDELVAAHAAGKAVTLEKGPKGLPIPLHPGAERYYQEKGVLK
jgi:TRAP transporter TAXI family solute receptor